MASESEGAIADCHRMGSPAAKRCFPLVYQTVMSDEGVGMASVVEVASRNGGRSTEGSHKSPPIAPTPNAEDLRKSRRDFKQAFFIDTVVPTNHPLIPAGKTPFSWCHGYGQRAEWLRRNEEPRTAALAKAA